jgi:phosphoglycolate phosphatase
VNTPDLILFDLDGTLVDSVPDIAQAVVRAMSDLELATVSEDDVRNWVGNGVTRLLERALEHSTGNAPDKALTSAARARWDHHYGQCNGNRSAVYPTVREVLSTFVDNGIALGCVTNKPVAFAHDLLAATDLAKFVPLVLGGDSLAVHKPDPAPLHHAGEHFGVAMSRTLMVGDSETDVKAARAAPCAVICVSYGYNHGRNIADAKPDAVIDDFGELLQILNGVRCETPI